MEMTVEDVDGGEHTMGQWRRISGAEDGPGMARAFADRSLDTGIGLTAWGAVHSGKREQDVGRVPRQPLLHHHAHAVDRDNEDGMWAVAPASSGRCTMTP